MGRNWHGGITGAAFLLLLVGSQDAIAGSCEINGPGHGGPDNLPNKLSFPIRSAPEALHLVDAEGKPFFLHGDTAWSLIAQLSYEDAELYLRDRKARGFNAILVNLLEHRFASRAPANLAGDKPFLEGGDYTRPNERYFAHADRVLKLACDLGMLVLLAPSYAGYGGGGEGWYQSMELAGRDAMRSYGEYLGRRYGGLDNIIWVHGGDYDPPNRGLVVAMVQGINEYDENAVHTAHGAPGTSAKSYWEGARWLTINTVYTYDSVKQVTLVERKLRGTLPFILIEGKYENEHETGAYGVRVQAYEALLGGAAGHLYGNNPIWHFDGPGIFPIEISWQDALDSPGARSMHVMQKIVSGLEWWRLQPDTSNRLAPPHEDVSVALTDDGSAALLYFRWPEPLQLNLDVFDGPMVQAKWIDPTTGTSREVQGSPFKPLRRTITPPGENGAGDGDWLLHLTTGGGT